MAGNKGLAGVVGVHLGIQEPEGDCAPEVPLLLLRPKQGEGVGVGDQKHSDKETQVGDSGQMGVNVLQASGCCLHLVPDHSHVGHTVSMTVHSSQSSEDRHLRLRVCKSGSSCLFRGVNCFLSKQVFSSLCYHLETFLFLHQIALKGD